MSSPVSMSADPEKLQYALSVTTSMYIELHAKISTVMI